MCRVAYGLCTGGECPIADLQRSTLHILSRGLWCKDLFLPKKKGVKERKEKPVQATVFTNHFIQSWLFSSWLPQLCSSPELLNKELYSTFVRTYTQTTKLAESVWLLLKEFNWYKVGIAFEQLPPWSNRKEDIVKFLKMRGVEIRIEREIPDEVQERENQPAKIRQLMEEMKPQARSKCFWLRGRFNKRIGRWLVVTNCVPRVEGWGLQVLDTWSLRACFQSKGASWKRSFQLRNVFFIPRLW